MTNGLRGCATVGDIFPIYPLNLLLSFLIGIINKNGEKEEERKICGIFCERCVR